MEGVSTRMGRYWKRRVLGYERINGSSGRSRMSRAQMGSTRNTKRRFWRIKIKPKVSLFVRKLCSPKKLLIRLRDAYVNMMLGVARCRVVVRGAPGAEAFGRAPLKDTKILEKYKLSSSRQLVGSHMPPRFGPVLLPTTPEVLRNSDG